MCIAYSAYFNFKDIDNDVTGGGCGNIFVTILIEIFKRADVNIS